MDQSKMSNSADQADSSDDLIAELARLMAEDAQDGREPATEPAKPAAPAQPEQAATLPPAQPFVRVPGQDRPEAQSQTPAPTSEAPTGTGTPAQTSRSFLPEMTSSAPPAANAPEQASVAPTTAPSEPQAPASDVNDLMSALSAATGNPTAQQSAGSQTSVPPTPEPQAPKQEQPSSDQGMFAEIGRALADQNERRQSEHEQEPDFGAAEQDFAETAPDLAPAAKPHSDLDPIAALIAAEQAAYDQSADGRGTAHNDPVEALRGELRGGLQSTSPAPERENDGDDAFGVAPVFGLGAPSRQEPARPTPEPTFEHQPEDVEGEKAEKPEIDPLDEIESLIGEAVRLGADNPPAQSIRTEPAPAEADVDDAAMAAEAAIRAITEPSAKAQGTEDVRTGFVEADIEAEGRSENPFQGSDMRRYVAPAIAATLLLAIGFGLFWVFGMDNGSDAGNAPVLTANADGAKEDATSATDEPSTAEQSVVFNSLDGTTDEGATEQVVSRDASGDVSRVIDTSNAATETGLANRKVRTVTVRPDGTIVTGEDALAGNEALPIERPAVPELPSDVATANVEDFQAASGFTDQPVITDESAIAGTQTTPPGAGDIVLDAPVPAPRISTRTASVTTPAIVTTPATPVSSGTGTTPPGGAVDLLGTTPAAPAAETALASTPAVSTPAASVPSATIGGNAAAYVQLSSQRSEEAAQQTISTLQSQFANQLGGTALEIQRVDLADRGIFFRVRMPASSLDQANSVCNSIISAGGDCFVRNN